MDQQRRAEVGEDAGGLERALGRVARDAGVESPTRLHCGVQGTHRLFEGSVGVGAVAVEDIDVVDAHAGQRLIERCEQVLA